MHGTGLFNVHQQPDGRRLHHHDERPPLRRRVEFLDSVRPARDQLDLDRRRRVRQADPRAPSTASRIAGTSRSLRVIVSSGVMWSQRDQGRPARPQPAPDHGRLARIERGDRHGDEHHACGLDERDRDASSSDRTHGWSPTTAATSCPARASSVESPCAASPRSATTRTRRSRRRPSHVSTASATRSPATSRRWTTTAPSCCSGAGASASTPAARRSTPKRSRRALKLHPAVADAAVVGLPDEKLRAGHHRPRRAALGSAIRRIRS